jgi:hypothetical protein
LRGLADEVEPPFRCLDESLWHYADEDAAVQIELFPFGIERVGVDVVEAAFYYRELAGLEAEVPA